MSKSHEFSYGQKSDADMLSYWIKHTGHAPEGGCPLWAKWRTRDGKGDFARGYTFYSHMRSVFDAHEMLFHQRFGGIYGGAAHALYDKMNLTEVSFEQFERLCYVALAVHDLGKSGWDFQHMMWRMEITKNDPTPERYHQHIRHEFLSGLLIQYVPEIRAWVEEAVGPEYHHLVMAAAFGHHIKADSAKAIRIVPDVSGPAPVYLKRMSQSLRRVMDRPDIPTFPELKDLDTWGLGDAILAAARANPKTYPGWAGSPKTAPTFRDLVYGNNGNQLLTDIYKNALSDAHLSLAPTEADKQNDRPLYRAVKWMVMLADTYGSITPDFAHRTDPNRDADIEDFWKGFQTAFKDCTNPTPIDHSSRFTKAYPQLRPAQQEMLKNRGKNVILTASTGSGKTLSALVWANHRPLFVLTPTTDATAGLFRQYGDSKSSLRSSRAILDYNWSVGNNGYGDDDETRETRLDVASLFGDTFRDFDKSVCFATVDQIVGVMTNMRKAIMLVPRLLLSNVVFDEVHQMKNLLGNHFVTFLDTFPRLNYAVMTATLPQSDADQFKRRGFTPINNHQESTYTQPRYRITWISSKDARSHFGPGTLWFHNTVNRCVAGHTSDPADTIYLHSRYRLCDRVNHRRRLVNSFQAGGTGDLGMARCTQVAEVSLDLSAKTMITELCPPDAFVQRLGRLNRRCEYGVSDVFVYMPDDPFPYDNVTPISQSNKFKAWKNFVFSLTRRVISQADLETAYQAFASTTGEQIFPANGFNYSLSTYTTHENLREEGYTTPCLLDTDVAAIRAMVKQGASRATIRKEVIRREVPVKKSDADVTAFDVFEYRKVVPARLYSIKIGI